MNYMALASASNNRATLSIVGNSLKKQKAFLIALLSVFCFSSLLVVEAKGTTSRCRTCEDILQHAAGLSAMEQHLMEENNDPLQAMDKKARNWYAKFQKGGLFYDGWQEISEKVIANVPEQTKGKIEIVMLELGVKIGCEWSKENEIRKISTAMLRGWGKQLRKTISDSPAQLPILLSSIKSEVDGLIF